MSEADTAWIETALTSARPQAVGALLRYFRDLDTAEEAFQNACLRALNMSRADCRNFALERSWENSARQFIGNLATLQPSRAPRPARRVAGRSAVPN